MRILFLSPYIPSPVRIRPYSWIRALAGLGHDVHLVALRPPEDAWAPEDELRKLCASVDVLPLSRSRTLINAAMTLPTGRPLQLAYSHSSAAERHIAKLAAKGSFDVVHIEHLRGVAMASRLLGSRAALRGVPTVWDAVDSISALFEETARLAPGRGARLMATLDVGRTRRFEARAPRLFDRTLVTSPRDARAFAKLPGATATDRIVTIPNGVDTDYFHPAKCQPLPFHSGPFQPWTGTGRDAVVFSGKLSYHANTAAALRLVQRVMPLVWATRPNAPVILAGKDPPEVIRQLAADKRVQVTGYLDDLRPVFARAAVAACPLVYGAGIQNKVLEAMACGIPVVTTTDAGAALSASSGREVILAGTDAEFAQAIGALLDSPAQRRAIGQAGRAYVEREHQWPRLGERLTAIYADARAQKRGTVAETQASRAYSPATSR